MPRISAAALGVVPAVPLEFPPPAHLNAAEAAVFRDVVARSDPRHFRHEDRELLGLYACHTVAARKLMGPKSRAPDNRRTASAGLRPPGPRPWEPRARKHVGSRKRRKSRRRRSTGAGTIEYATCVYTQFTRLAAGRHARLSDCPKSRKLGLRQPLRAEGGRRLPQRREIHPGREKSAAMTITRRRRRFTGDPAPSARSTETTGNAEPNA